MSWRGALFMALVAFVIFYVATPSFLHSLSDGQAESVYKPFTDGIIFRRIHWVERFGLALTFACLIIAAWKGLVRRGVSSGGQWIVRAVSRLLGREAD